METPFVTENGAKVLFGDMVKGPTVLSILYYKCPNACGILLTSISTAISAFTNRPDTAPNLVTLTVDENETPADALNAKSMAFESMQNQYPAQNWHFLTGANADIRKITDAAGFQFVKKGKEFEHPVGLIILSPKGKIVRYIMGTDYLTMDLSISLMEASSGAVKPTIARVLRFCFSKDPANHRFVLNTLRVSGVVIVTLASLFVLYLVLSMKKKQSKERTHG